MEQSSKTLTFVVPAYNMETYLERCVESLLSATDNSDIEVLIVDDGSSDGTPELADMYERRWPGNVRAIHQVNKGHGGAVNTGIANATGMYVKVVDADDWVDMPSIDTLMGTLRVQRVATDPVDMIVTNYVYDKVGKRVKHTVNFRHAMAANTVLGWDDLGCFGVAEYILMHALIYRTQVQSVQTDVMIRRVAQLRLVNQRMVEATPEPGTVPDGLYRYMIHFLAIESSVTSVFLILSKDKANYRLKDELWADIDKASPAIGRDVRRKLVSRALNLRGSVGRWVIRRGYVVAEKVVGFN